MDERKWAMLASMSASAHASRSSLDRAGPRGGARHRDPALHRVAEGADRVAGNAEGAGGDRAGNISPNIIWNSGESGRRSRA